MDHRTEKPSKETKALSLYLMAFKSDDYDIKDKNKQMNRLWSMVQNGELEKSDYLHEVEVMLTELGGYEAVLEKTVRYYIDKSGEYRSRGDDQYAKDAQEIADKVLKG